MPGMKRRYIVLIAIGGLALVMVLGSLRFYRVPGPGMRPTIR